MAVDAPSGIVKWYNTPLSERGWNSFRAQLTGKDYPGASRKTSYVKLSDKEADELIENIKKDPEGIPIFDEENAPDKAEEYQKWLVARYLTKPREEAFDNTQKASSTPPKSSEIVPTTPSKDEEDLVDEEIDERILTILGLQDTIDIDYGTYKTLLREKLAESQVGKSSLSREEEVLLQEEFKNVKRKTGRFRPKPKKFDTDAFFGRKKDEQVFKPKALLPPADKLADVSEEPKEEKKNDILDFLKGDFLNELKSIREVVESIAENLQKQYDLDKQQRETSRRESELARGRRRERDLESKEEKEPTLLQKVTKPFTSLFDTIKNFLLNVLLGSAVVWLLDVIKNPQKILQPVQNVLNGIYGFFNNIIQWIDDTVVDPIRGFIDNVNNTIKSFIDQVNSALQFIPGYNQIQAPQLPNIPNAPTISAPNITGIPVQRASGGGGIKGRSKTKSPSLNISEETGFVTKDTGVEVSGMGADTQLTALRKGEFVLVPGAAQDLGIDLLETLNKKHGGTNNPQVASIGSNKIVGMSGGGIVGGYKKPASARPAKVSNNKLMSNKPVGANQISSSNKPVNKQTPSSAAMPKMSSADYYSLLAVAALEDDTPQGRADVAQSIYNRVLAAQNYNVNFFQKKNTIKDHILARGQYQPIFSNVDDWKNISDKKSAAVAVMNSTKGKKYKWKMNDAMKYLDSTESALKNPKLQSNAHSFVGGRTFFLSASQQDNMRRGDVTRDKKSNFFTPWSLEGTKYDMERRNAAAPVPEMMRAKPTPVVPQRSKKKSPSMIPFPVKPRTRSAGGSTSSKSTPKVSFSSVDPGNITVVITSAILGLIN
jgi:hypothetical protein